MRVFPAENIRKVRKPITLRLAADSPRSVPGGVAHVERGGRGGVPRKARRGAGFKPGAHHQPKPVDHPKQHASHL